MTGAAPTTALLDVAHLSVIFGKLRAVDDVSFSLSGGDLLGLIGPNGAGKTTLLRAIATLQPATHGHTSLLGERLVPGALEPLSRVGFTPDTPPVYEKLTVRQFLRVIASGYGLSRSEADERIAFWLERVWLNDKAEQKIKELSRGMRQRIGIVRTLIANPLLILLDEPAAGLDPAGRIQFRQLLLSLREQGKVLIVSSHILSDMQEYCSHIGIMSRGKLVQFGTVGQLTHQTEESRRQYLIELARPIPQAAIYFESLPDIEIVKIDGEKITCQYHAGREAAAELLRHLVREGLPIASFTPQVFDLEAAYLRAGVGQVD